MPGENANNFIQKVEATVHKLVTLDVRTIVGTVEWDPDGDTSKVKLGPNAKEMRTCIDLLQGDITTALDDAFVTGPLQSLRDFHALREKQGADLVHSNIAALERLVQFARSLVAPPK